MADKGTQTVEEGEWNIADIESLDQTELLLHCLYTLLTLRIELTGVSFETAWNEIKVNHVKALYVSCMRLLHHKDPLVGADHASMLHRFCQPVMKEMVERRVHLNEYLHLVYKGIPSIPEAMTLDSLRYDSFGAKEELLPHYLDSYLCMGK